MHPLLLLLPLLSTPNPPQDPPPPLPEGVVARCADREVLLEEYKDFLYLRMGKRAVQEFLQDELVAAEAARYGIVIEEEQVARKVEEMERELAEAPRRQGSFADELKNQGFSLETWRKEKRLATRRDLRLDALVLATRVVTDDQLQAAFQERYGPNGLALRLRHIVVQPNRLRAERIRAGERPADLNMDMLQQEAARIAREAHERLVSGEPWGVVCAEVTHDLSTRDAGGELPRYDGRIYGPVFAEVAYALEVGAMSGPVETPIGWHIIQVIERTQTAFSDVRSSLTEELLTAPPTWPEKSAYIQHLIAEADIQLW